MLRTIATLSLLLPALALAQTGGGTLVGKSLVVNNGPGDQTDPHISGALVAYTSETDGASEIRYHDLETGADQAIPRSGAFDFVSDISGSTVVFTRVTSGSSIYTYDVFSEAPASEVAPQEGANRRGAVIGGGTVAWQDFSYRGTTLEPEIATFDLASRTLTRLTDDGLMDRTPAVSADGQVIVWSKCQTDGTRCDIWQARAQQGGFVTQALTGAAGEDIQPDTNGRVVVYASTRVVEGVTERDIYWQPVGGGPELRLALAGVDTNPSISGSLLAFERFDATAAQPSYDIYLYDLETQTLYALTQTAANENLNDISVGVDGTIRVVWTVPENGDYNVHALSLRLPRKDPGPCEEPEDNVPAEAVCEAPGSRPLLGSLEVARATGKPTEASLAFAGSGQGVLCVDNGFQGERATSGEVTLNGAQVVDPSQFKHAVASVAQRVELSGDNLLAASVAGQPGSAFRVRVYGAPPKDCAGAESLAPDERLVPGILVAPVSVLLAPSEVPMPQGEFMPGGELPADAEPEPVAVLEAEPLPHQGPVGCSAGGGSLAAFGALALASLLIRRR